MAEATPIDVQWAAGSQQEVGQYGSKSRNWKMDASSVRLCGSTVETQQLLGEEIHGDHECRGRSSLILQMNGEVWAFNCQKLGCIKRKKPAFTTRLEIVVLYSILFFVFLFVEEGISVYFGLSGG